MAGDNKTKEKIIVSQSVDDLDVGMVGEIPANVLPGDNYIVAFKKAERGTFCGRSRIFLLFEIVLPLESQGLRLYLCCPEPDKKTYGLGSKFVAAWVIATGKFVTRRDRLSTKVFRGKYFRAVVRTVVKDQHGADKPLTHRYSKIDRLLECTVGLPRV